MANKVDGITLLQMIKDGKIKDRTNIIDNLGKKYIYYDSTGNLNEITQLIGDDEETERMYQFTPYQLISYTFEIIEEIEKPKDIQKLTICGKDIGYGVMEEWLDFPPYQNEKKICIAIEQIVINQNKIIEAVNYLLEKDK